MLTIYLDFKSPASYLSFKPVMTLLDRHKITAQWLPFQTKQESLAEPRADESRGDSHRRVRAKSRRDTHLLYAKLQQTPMKFPSQAGKTDLALSVLLQINQSPEKFIQSAFKAYWADNADLNNTEVISKLLSVVDIDPSDWNPQTSINQLNENQLNAEEAGIVDAPAFVTDNQLFIGREHLPWIETIVAANIEK